MKISEYNFFQRELASAAMGGSIFITTARIGVHLRRRNSQFVSHREIEFFEGDADDPSLKEGVFRLTFREIIYLSFTEQENFHPYPSDLIKGRISEDIAYLADNTIPWSGPLVWLYATPKIPVAFGRMANDRVRPFFQWHLSNWEGLSDEEIANQMGVTEFHWAKGKEPVTS